MNARALPLAVAIAATFGAGPAVAAVLPVTSCVDDGRAGTLRAAALLAHDGDTIDLTQLTCSTITLENGPIDSSLFGPNPLNYLTIVGPGQEALTISGGGASAVFLAGGQHFGSGIFTLENLTVAHGAKYDAAACVFAATGGVILNDVTVSDCHATQSNHVRGGGAVSAYHLYLTDSTISDSSVTAVGQGIATGGGAWAYTATVVRSTISGNTVSAQGAYAYLRYQTSGGGLYTRGPLTLIASTISGNAVEATAAGQDANGGGIGTRGRLTISGSTFAGNTADGAGGGLFVGFARYPMHFEAPTAVLIAQSISNSTFTGNSARVGGGIATESIDTTLTNSTLAFNDTAVGGALMIVHGGTANYAYSLDLESTIIAGNATGATPSHAADLATDPRITLTVVGANNLIGAADAAIVLPPDTLHDDPLLLPLADNGGPTWTMALEPASPAIDTGNDVANLATDQRGGGYMRVYGAASDIGAYELQPKPDVIFGNGFDP